jgi:hypothetical protein
MIKQKLLLKLESGFSHNTLSELETICEIYLSRAENKIDPFVFLAQCICSRVREYLDSSQPILTEDHQKIEQTVRGPLEAAINSLDSQDLNAKAVLFGELIAAYQKIKTI